jgi:hypothetical protein
LIVYVDNIMLNVNDNEEIQRLKNYLASEFKIKDLGNLKYFLGIELSRSRHGIFLSQLKYVFDLLNETRMLGCKTIDNPVEQNKKLKERDKSTLMDKGRYQWFTG